MASCCGSPLAATSAPGRVCGWAQPRHPPRRLRLSPAMASGGLGGTRKTPNTEPSSTWGWQCWRVPEPSCSHGSDVPAGMAAPRQSGEQGCARLLPELPLSATKYPNLGARGVQVHPSSWQPRGDLSLPLQRTLHLAAPARG